MRWGGGGGGGWGRGRVSVKVDLSGYVRRPGTSFVRRSRSIVVSWNIALHGNTPEGFRSIYQVSS